MNSNFKNKCFINYSQKAFQCTVLRTKWHGGVLSALALYSGWPGFKSRPEDRLFWLRFFVVFLSPFGPVSGQ
jgi:hypothetical protein